ncbi:tRNA dihydrouridine(20/20a) synthase DusA [Paracoccus sp. P2]|uniref:tRNA-dihydrouridine(20/20a) synthase n=2 Tax=Paracoccus pantotrophus TaxID=82367 RepID=A0A7H9BW87_PARPN|nr:tRNA dihydrouridine(20/20a) synthase DusA [Paracoccus pantotrophus]MDF3854907.1 tRNA dihydrouridine(20/20a) synthase DusA [Paracoccus pantotrophus]QFG37456.1 tRNA dihydrouridine(20/20a) synthase DusA [Paracoccus pantotrophus]QLH15078.1 tRNA dihydrouridine(20/20a) synthase DusA [Paracoccus pantotrophus]RDD96584.1 tRNA dihydrouridine(20/20a) synthase DusA [Paracoccus pantotrophus]RNI16025.1 tRNA dihydrouridine(20/20a) synthase DusA [Paracoccus pantotrophus]
MAETEDFINRNNSARLSVAPMMDWTDSLCRRIHRLLSRRALLYTEMVTAPALVYGDRAKLLDFDAAEHPVALQLGGSDPAQLAEAARIGADWGYDEINLNVGCPSDRVQSGCFGAVLMTRPDLVAECVAAMVAASPVEVTVKCRIGVDDQLPEAVLPDFIARMRDVGVRRMTIHARKAWLQGLSPRENREIPPLDYPLVHRMKQAFPDLHLSINGGIASLDAVRDHLRAMDGVMVGRAAYHQPWDMLGEADRLWGEKPRFADPLEAARALRELVDAHLASGGRLHQATRHMLGLFHGRPGARGWRRQLSEGASRARDRAEALAVYDAALAEVMAPA